MENLSQRIRVPSCTGVQSKWHSQLLYTTIQLHLGQQRIAGTAAQPKISLWGLASACNPLRPSDITSPSHRVGNNIETA
ncbi:unnamed protein product [Prunus armeniaca]|uniref:Uncharacterized protein n=1 Tax=Prunus armeniaca TaxID=36596 RepID=A0A6J5TL70_PRUAR|nr:unnamed protein product [Prunus armeniaca]